MPHRNQTIFDQGWMAWTDGARFNENPHPLGTLNYAAWLDGWNSACEDHEYEEARLDAEEGYGNRVDYEYDRRG